MHFFFPLDKPVSAFIESLSLLLDRNFIEGSLAYILGDLNIDLLRYPKTHNTLDLVNLFLPYAYIRFNSKPTRASSNCISLLDVVFTNDVTYMVNAITKVLTCSILYHFLLIHRICELASMKRASS